MKTKLFLIAILIAYLLSSCMTVEKATNFLDRPANREAAAKYCGDKFSVKETTEATVVEDTAASNQTKRELNHYKDSILNSAVQRNDSIERMRDEIESLKFNGAFTQATADILQAQLAGIKPVDTAALRKSIAAKIWATIKPCKDSTITITKENTARVEQYRLRGDRLQTNLDDTTAKRDKWRLWCLITWGIIAAYVLLRVFVGKLGMVGQFIK